MENETLDNLNFDKKAKDLEGAGGILAMGIIALPFSLGFIGLILSIITLAKAGKAINLYNNNPGSYTESSYKKVKAGKVCAIVSLSLLVVSIPVIILIVNS